jgi:hypothetical protein
MTEGTLWTSNGFSRPAAGRITAALAWLLILVQADAFTTKVITITASATVHPNSGSER